MRVYSLYSLLCKEGLEGAAKEHGHIFDHLRFRHLPPRREQASVLLCERRHDGGARVRPLVEQLLEDARVRVLRREGGTCAREGRARVRL